MSSIEPSSASTAEDFVMLLRQARAMSELTYWQLEEAANAAGHDLEPSVLAETLGLAALPDETLVTALLHACGYSPQQIDHWLDVRGRLATTLAPSRPGNFPPPMLSPLRHRPEDRVRPHAGPDEMAPSRTQGAPTARHPGERGMPQRSPVPAPAPLPPSLPPSLPPLPSLPPQPPPQPPSSRHPGDSDAGTPETWAHEDEQTGPDEAGWAEGGTALDEATAPTSTLSALSASRARHSLRIPGRGSRRAPSSRLKTWALAAAALVVGIGGIATFVALVNNDGSDSGAPVYAPATVRTAQGPQPSATPAGQEAPATPTATPSPSRSAAPSSAPPAIAGVLRSGTATLQTGQSIDLDFGASSPDIIVTGDGDGIRADPSGRHFAREPTATKQACAAADGYQKTMQSLEIGNGICVRTDKGRYAYITITRTSPLAFSYVVWS